MQLKIARLLNKALIYLAVLMAFMLAGGVYVTQGHPEFLFHYIVGCIIAIFILLLIFRYYEANWDKKVIIKMALNKKIALVNIGSGTRELPMRDSGFKNYWLYSFEGTLYPQEGSGQPVKFYEKMSVDTSEIPTGSVYVTYDETKPAQIFIIPTDLLARMPHLADVIKSYENRKDIDCRYLYVYYKNGMELKRYQDIV